MSNIAVACMVPEELGLRRELLAHGLVAVDVLLAPTNDADEPELERVDAAGEDVESVRAGVHEVKLGQDPDGTSTLRVDLARELERLGVCEIYVRRGNGKDNAGG